MTRLYDQQIGPLNIGISI